ncbi:phospholipase A2 homolog sphenotoxin basic subunit B-like [Tachyglossus aculeatus]|uniref:phospholipase A2 homolog sphenotoxin basic subunit B-like n=1 Tax=Tachyglossus aculeatus TaxID=9261 RepID=UPI0018F2E5FB|nr:phospholipase A2 homolog sphenotoxin basic subunit B-like [Tachyglossus aculeatus]
MEALQVWAMLFAVCVIPGQGNVLQLRKMIRLTTGKNPITQYGFYGCHCGIGGKGQPKDATDWCCQIHDCCYAGLTSHRCWTTWDRYRYSHTFGVIRCGPGSWCEKNLCECDKALALCLQRNLHTYQPKLRFYWSLSCKGRTMNC